MTDPDITELGLGHLSEEEWEKVLEAIEPKSLPELIASDKEWIKTMELMLDHARETLRNHEREYEQSLPMICSCCERGVTEPHTHYFKVRGKEKSYLAEMIPRP